MTKKPEYFVAWYTPASFPELPPMNGGKGRKGSLNALHLCLSENAGLPVAGYQESGILYGNGVTMVPKVHAVMAWAAKMRNGHKGAISSEEL